jgi:lactate dehydrogenase-like 2-hydroxyacid dehydrogenase
LPHSFTALVGASAGLDFVPLEDVGISPSMGVVVPMRDPLSRIVQAFLDLVTEHVVMMILSLVRNYIPSPNWARKAGWNIADCVGRSYDLEGMHVGTVAAGRIGLAVLRRLKPFDVKLHYTDRHRLPAAIEAELGLTFHDTAKSLITSRDIMTLNCPLHPETENMVDATMLSKMKRGTYLVNTARGRLVDRDAIATALESGQLGVIPATCGILSRLRPIILGAACRMKARYRISQAHRFRPRHAMRRARGKSSNASSPKSRSATNI